mgnify:CR=1 FL=1
MNIFVSIVSCLLSVLYIFVAKYCLDKILNSIKVTSEAVFVPYMMQNTCKKSCLIVVESIKSFQNLNQTLIEY